MIDCLVMVSRCLLTDGDYEFYLEELKGSARVGTSLSTWEDMVTDSDVSRHHSCKNLNNPSRFSDQS